MFKINIPLADDSDVTLSFNDLIKAEIFLVTTLVNIESQLNDVREAKRVMDEYQYDFGITHDANIERCHQMMPNAPLIFAKEICDLRAIVPKRVSR